MEVDQEMEGRVVGGVDTHKDLHIAAVVDNLDRVLGSRCFPTGLMGWTPPNGLGVPEWRC